MNKERRDNMITLNDNVVEITRFPDNTTKFDIKGGTIKSNNKLQWNFESMEELFTLIGLADKLKNTDTELFIPYLPNARMDKICNQMEGFMLKYFVEIVDALGFKKITLLDPHSAVYKKFVKHTNWVEDNFTVRNLIFKTIMNIKTMNDYEDVTLVYPDKGARNRYSELIGDEENLYGEKVRNQETGQITSFDLVGEIPMNPVLIVDDICSKGGTFYFTAKKLREKGFTGEIYLYITHAEETIFDGELLAQDSEITKVFTTNSLLKSKHEKITVYSI